MFHNKTFVVTGSNGFLGKNLKNHLIKKGANFYGLDLQKGKNTIQCDITNEIEVKKAFKIIRSKHEPDVLINNAAINPANIKKLKENSFKFSNYSLELWRKSLEVDLVGSFLTSKHCCKSFERKNKGLIINISSIYGIVGSDQNIYSNKSKKYYGYKPIEYSVSKAGLVGFTKSLASFYKNTNIRVITLVLGGIENNQNSNFKNKYSNKTIINRMAKISEIINYIDFYASDKATYSTGSSIIVDGGATAIL